MPYSDNPNSSYSDNNPNNYSDGGGYRDKPDPPSTLNPFDDDGTPQQYDDEDSIPISSIVPPNSIFPFVGDINNNIINRSVSPTSDEESVGDFARSLGLDNVDDTDTNHTNNINSEGGLTNGAPTSSNDFIWHLTPGSAGKEVDSIFVDGYDKNQSSNQQNATPIRKVIKLALLGFAMGIIVMLVLLLVGTDTSGNNVDDGGSSSRLGAPNDSSTTTLLDGFDQSIDTTALNLDEDKPDEIIVAEEEGEKDSNQEEDDTPVQTSEKDDNQVLPETSAAAKEDEADDKPQESESTVEDVDKTNPPKEDDEVSTATNAEGDDSDVPAHVHDEDLEEMSTAYTIAVENINHDNESSLDTPTNVIQPKDPSEVQPPPAANQNNNGNNAGDTNSNGNKYPYPNRTDVSKFCGGCRYKGSLFSCDQRVTYMKQRFGMTENEAKIGVMKWGHCPDPTGNTPKPQVGPELSSSGEPLPTYGGCRKRYNPNLGNVLDNFCGHCEWKNSAYTCFKRALWLRDHYGQTHEQAMINLMNNGYCKDERSEDDLQRLKEWGLDDWCSYCTTNDGYTCHDKLAPTFWNPDQCHSTKIALLADGQCKLPPYCDVNEDEDTSKDSSDDALSTDDDSIDSNPFLNCDFSNP